jgi:hypothetical protein
MKTRGDKGEILNLRESPVKILCSHCQKVVGIREHHTDPDLGPVLCPDCGDHFINEYGGVSLGEYLDRFEEPLIVINSELRVVACNRKGRGEVEATGIRPYGLLNGDFMDCRNSTLGDGCGQTPYCPQCGIRNSVTQTLQTGKPLERVSVTFTGSGENGTCTREWSLSTRKVGETVHVGLRHPAKSRIGTQFRRV